MATVKVGKGRGNFKIPVDKNCPDGYNIQALKLHMRECWNGRQARLRCVCPMACEFESHLPHQKNHGSKCDKHGETWFFLFYSRQECLVFRFLDSRLGVIWVLWPKKQRIRVLHGRKTTARSGIGSGLFCVYGTMRGGFSAAALQADRRHPRLL